VDGPSDMIEIASEAVRVTVNPRVGGTITAITHLGVGLSVLGDTPWDASDAPIAGLGARDETQWLTRYGGGWPLLFPNGGDACTVDGVFHGFHGEASIAPWRASVSDATLKLARRFFTVPVEMRRELAVDSDLLIIREHVRLTGPEPITVMWGHHPSFGSDLLAGPVEITSGARCITADAAYNPAANPLVPGGAGQWPVLPGKAGRVDLGRPADIPGGGLAAMAYLHDFEASWAAIRRLDNAIAVALSWDGRRFPCAWLWLELGGTTEAPWHGRGRLVGVEPNTTWPANGLAYAVRSGSPLLRLRPGEELSAELRLHVFRPFGRITGVDGAGRAITSGC
jgi:hypothetical protein